MNGQTVTEGVGGKHGNIGPLHTGGTQYGSLIFHSMLLPLLWHTVWESLLKHNMVMLTMKHTYLLCLVLNLYRGSSFSLLRTHLGNPGHLYYFLRLHHNHTLFQSPW